MRMSIGSRIPAAALAALGLLAQPLFVEGKLVFAHYMVSSPSTLPTEQSAPGTEKAD